MPLLDIKPKTAIMEKKKGGGLTTTHVLDDNSKGFLNVHSLTAKQFYFMSFTNTIKFVLRTRYLQLYSTYNYTLHAVLMFAKAIKYIFFFLIYSVIHHLQT